MDKIAQTLAIGLIIVFGSAPSLAFDASSTAEVNLGSDRVIVSGYDVVAYHAGTAMPGRPELSAEFNGAVYYFASAAHRDTVQRSLLLAYAKIRRRGPVVPPRAMSDCAGRNAEYQWGVDCHRSSWPGLQEAEQGGDSEA